MSLRIIFFIAISSVLLSGCRESSLNLGGDKTLASVGDKILKLSDIWVVHQDLINGEDSVSFVKHQTERWVQNSVKLQEAERVFASSSKDIDALVEGYRNTLMVKKLEKSHINQNIAPQIEESQIEEYYNQNGDNFRLATRLVKGRIVVVPKNYGGTKEFQAQMKTIASKKNGDFKSICEKRGLTLEEYTSAWVDYNDFLSQLPIVRGGDYSEYTNSLGEIHQLEGRQNKYIFQITDVLNVGDTEPLERVREKIQYILNNKFQSELLKSYDSLLLRSAIDRGDVRYYTTSDEDDDKKTNE